MEVRDLPVDGQERWGRKMLAREWQLFSLAAGGYRSLSSGPLDALQLELGLEVVNIDSELSRRKVRLPQGERYDIRVASFSVMVVTGERSGVSTVAG